MGFLQFILAAEPNYRQSKSGRKSGFKINSAAMTGKIGDKKFAAANASDNFVINLVVVLLSVNSEWFVTRTSDFGFNSCPSRISGFIKPHRNETYQTLNIGLLQRVNVRPTVWCDSITATIAEFNKTPFSFEILIQHVNKFLIILSPAKGQKLRFYESLTSDETRKTFRHVVRVIVENKPNIFSGLWA